MKKIALSFANASISGDAKSGFYAVSWEHGMGV